MMMRRTRKSQLLGRAVLGARDAYPLPRARHSAGRGRPDAYAQARLYRMSYPPGSPRVSPPPGGVLPAVDELRTDQGDVLRGVLTRGWCHRATRGVRWDLYRSAPRCLHLRGRRPPWAPFSVT